MKINRSMASCLVLLVSGVALAASPGWKTGIVREVGSNVQRVEVSDGNGDPGLKGTGLVTQYCTIEVGQQLVVGERSVHSMERSNFTVKEDYGVQLRIDGDMMTLRDSKGNQRTFHVLKTVPDTPANQPDRTAFAERPLLIQ